VSAILTNRRYVSVRIYALSPEVKSLQMIFKARFWNDTMRLLCSTVRLECHAGHTYSATGHRLVEAQQVTGWNSSSLQLLKKVQPFVQLRADVRDVFVPF